MFPNEFPTEALRRLMIPANPLSNHAEETKSISDLYHDLMSCATEWGGNPWTEGPPTKVPTRA